MCVWIKVYGESVRVDMGVKGKDHPLFEKRMRRVRREREWLLEVGRPRTRCDNFGV